MTVPSLHWQRLGQALRGLRAQAGLTVAQLAERSGVSRSAVSAFELGQSLPTAAKVTAICQAAGASQQRTGNLLELRDRAAVVQRPWRHRLDRGLAAIQKETGELERSAASVRVFHPTIVPGLCQTPEYGRAVRELRWPGGEGLSDGLTGLLAGLQGQLDRQRVLFEPGRRFAFVVGEPALRWRLGPAPMMLAQVDRLAQVATMPTVDLRVLPLDAETLVWHTHPFVIFDRERDPVVHLELLTGECNLFDPDEVQSYVQAFERLVAASAAGPELVRLLTRVVGDLRRG